MKASSAILIVVMLLAPGIARSQGHVLKFVKPIGVARRIDVGGWMSFVAFSPDGTRVASDGATTSSDVSGDLSLWSFPKGRLIRHLSVRPTAMSADWKYYASSHGVSDLKSGKPLISVPDSVYPTYAFSPDSRYVAESSSKPDARGVHTRVMALPSGKPASAFGAHEAFSITISPDGKTLASGHWDGVTLWNMTTGRRLGVLRGFGRYVKSLAFSRNGRLLAAGDDAGGLQIWDMRHRRRLHSLKISGGEVSAPAFSPDGRRVAVGVYGTGAVWLIDIGKGAIVDHRQVSDLGCGSVAFSPNGSFLITPSSGGLITWPYDTGGTIRVFRVSRPPVRAR